MEVLDINWTKGHNTPVLYWCCGSGEEFEQFCQWLDSIPLIVRAKADDWYVFRFADPKHKLQFDLFHSHTIEECEFTWGHIWEYDYQFDDWWDDTYWDMTDQEWDWEHGKVSPVRCFY